MVFVRQKPEAVLPILQIAGFFQEHPGVVLQNELDHLLPILEISTRGTHRKIAAAEP
jgi:hypothetical protein